MIGGVQGNMGTDRIDAFDLGSDLESRSGKGIDAAIGV
jgi:hypothetical protein